ncbi:MAG: alpha/beta hydrolase [Sphingobium sp.]
MSVLRRNNVHVSGDGARTIIFAHGFGCDQTAWKTVAPAFQQDYRTIMFDHVGAGASDLSAYRSDRYGSLHGYKQDVLEIFEALDLNHAIFVGHSVSSMIGMLAAIEAPERFASLVMVCPSPCYVDEPGYVGGFDREDLEELLEVVDSNFLGWSRQAAPSIMGNPERPELGMQLTQSFCRTDPAIAREFARVTFLSDHRADLPRCTTPTLVLQTLADMVAPVEVGAYIAQEMPAADLVVMDATGHCPHMSAPAETIAAIRRHIGH